MKKQIPYGVADYEELVRDNDYFVDKTMYIQKLEKIKNPVFLRPRRFGKSLLCRILECYYNIGHKEQFEELFGNTWIGKNPTPLRNSFFVLHIDFSTVDPSGALEKIEKDFNTTCNLCMETVVYHNRGWFKEEATIMQDETPSSNLKRMFKAIRKHRLPRLFVIIIIRRVSTTQAF